MLGEGTFKNNFRLLWSCEARKEEKDWKILLRENYEERLTYSVSAG